MQPVCETPLERTPEPARSQTAAIVCREHDLRAVPGRTDLVRPAAHRHAVLDPQPLLEHVESHQAGRLDGGDAFQQVAAVVHAPDDPSNPRLLPLGADRLRQKEPQEKARAARYLLVEEEALPHLFGRRIEVPRRLHGLAARVAREEPPDAAGQAAQRFRHGPHSAAAGVTSTIPQSIPRSSQARLVGKTAGGSPKLRSTTVASGAAARLTAAKRRAR